MDNHIRTWLLDVVNAIKEIESFFEDRPKSLESYRADIRTKRAVERNLEIIGEAVNRIIKHSPDFKITHARMIVGTRNRIIHGYDSVSDEFVLSVVSNHLPILKKEVLDYLN